jgi:hypothetical protein
LPDVICLLDTNLFGITMSFVIFWIRNMCHDESTKVGVCVEY